jgi:Cu2+-exporting ATPase/Cu+-exporting ATPase
MQTKNYEVKGMHCASCATIITKTFKKQAGVEMADVNYATQTAKVIFDPHQTSPEQLSSSIEPFGYSLHLPTETAESMSLSANEHATHLGLGQAKQD